MDRIISEELDQGYNDHKEVSEGLYGDFAVEYAYKNGWIEGYEWVLIELAINKKISEDTLKEYMDIIK